METFIKYNLTFKNISDSSDDILKKFFDEVSREEIIAWLSWNDRNGIYTDKDSLTEFGYIMSKQEGVEIMRRQIMENR